MTITAKDLAAFNGALRKSAKDLVGKRLLVFQRKVTLAVLRGVIFKTPVDTGRARGGWIVGVNKVPNGMGRPDRNGGSAFAEGASKIGSLRPFSVVYVANNVVYVKYLEDGSSAQAPRGMLRLTLAELQTQLPALAAAS